MFKWLKNLFGGNKSKSFSGTFRPFYAKYDAAVTNDENRKHWANADNLSARAANSPQIRQILRSRARYEVANNSYAKGIILTLANYCIGSGPKLQMRLPDEQINEFIESEFRYWAKEISLDKKLRCMRMAKAQDGEAFAMLVTNKNLPTPVKLDIRLIEADQITTPNIDLTDPLAVDGIVFDEYGNPVEYHVLKYHPGDVYLLKSSLEYYKVPADKMIHWFRLERPGQVRGIPELTPALPLFAQLRRYTLAVISAAETAATFAGILYTDNPPGGEAENGEAFDPIELVPRALLTMPGGWKMEQLKAEQPSTTYPDFKKEILNEIARALEIPYNIAAGNSSTYNYASGRLDHQTFFRSIKIEQTDLAHTVLDKILTHWLDEAVLINGYLPENLGTYREWPHVWYFDGIEHVDPLKEAAAQSQRLASNTTTLAIEYAKQGIDWQEALRQRAREKQLMQELGLIKEDVQVNVPNIQYEEE